MRIRKATNCDGYFYSIKQKEIVDSLNEYDKENVYYLDFKDIRNYQYHQIDLENFRQIKNVKEELIDILLVLKKENKLVGTISLYNYGIRKYNNCIVFCS